MSLLSWLTKTVDSDTERFLPSPLRGPELGVPSSYIDAANKSISTPKTANRKHEYNFFDDKQAAKIGKYALEHGIARCSRHFSKELDKPVSESTVRSIRDRHKRRVLKVKRNTVSTDKDVKFAGSTLPKENRGPPLLLGDMDKSIQNYLKAIREAGGFINTSIAIAGSKGIIESSNPGLLIENGVQCR